MNTLVESSYVGFVNLDHRRDRLTRMEYNLKKVGLKAERQRGMLPAEYKGPEFKVAKMRARTPGAIGCHYSQVAIMEKALLHGKHAFVMEDDLIFCKDFKIRMDMIDEFTQREGWDVIWLGGTFHINPPYWHKDLGRDAECTVHPHFMRTYGAFCTYAYIVNGRRLEAILKMMDERVHESIGIDYLFIQLQPRLKTFAFVPGAITQYDNMSDIGRGVTRFSGFAKLGPYWYQDWLSGFDPLKFNWHEAKRR